VLYLAIHGQVSHHATQTGNRGTIANYKIKTKDPRNYSQAEKYGYSFQILQLGPEVDGALGHGASALFAFGLHNLIFLLCISNLSVGC